MKAVILAAGRGSRLQSRTDAIPKGMVRVAGRPMLEYQREALLAAGAQSVTVVTGYRGDVIADHGFDTIPNPDWDRGNMVSSLAVALEAFEGPLLFSYSDIVYNAAGLAPLFASDAALALSYDPDWAALWSRRFADPLSDAETFRLNPDDTIAEIGGRTDDMADIQGQFMGLFRVNAEGRGWIADLLAADPGARLGLDTTATLSALIADGKPVTAVPYRGGWCEVDDGDDLAVAEALIAEGRLHPGAGA